MCNKPEYSYEQNLRKLIAALDIADRLHHLPSGCRAASSSGWR